MTATDETRLIPAATVLLLRGGATDLEVLMLRRNSKIAFGGAWVFPGGRVDDAEMIEGDIQGSARRAAVREVAEETGLTVAADALETWTYWIPPAMPAAPTKGPRRRFSTWFFVTSAPDGLVTVDDGEILEHRWLTPDAALAQHADGEIELVPPTWVTLHQLQGHGAADDAMRWAAGAEPEEFHTRPIATDPALTLAWAGDAAYEGGSAETPGARNRLVLDPAGWRYERS
jgi:8-oxo-dGTP pyrophosphatase MutT (NUDIX family)